MMFFTFDNSRSADAAPHAEPYVLADDGVGSDDRARANLRADHNSGRRVNPRAIGHDGEQPTLLAVFSCEAGGVFYLAL